jgi:tetratricopeptide (TPR) repeat protein
VEWSLGHFAEAVACLQTSLDIAERQHDQWEIATAQVYLGMILYDQGQLPAALAQLTAVYPLAKTIGDPRLIANTLLISGRTTLLLGHLAEAEQQLSECLTLTKTTNDPNSLTYATLYLGIVKQAQGDLAAARQLIEQSMALFAEINELVGLERASITLGFLEIDAENFETAQCLFLTFLRTTQRIHSLRYILAAVMGTAVVQSHTGDPFTALVWTLAVLQHPGLDWENKQRAEKLRTQLEGQLISDKINTARQIASQKSFDTILADILEQ